MIPLLPLIPYVPHVRMSSQLLPVNPRIVPHRFSRACIARVGTQPTSPTPVSRETGVIRHALPHPEPKGVRGRACTTRGGVKPHPLVLAKGPGVLPRATRVAGIQPASGTPSHGGSPAPAHHRGRACTTRGGVKPHPLVPATRVAGIQPAWRREAAFGRGSHRERRPHAAVSHPCPTRPPRRSRRGPGLRSPSSKILAAEGPAAGPDGARAHSEPCRRALDAGRLPAAPASPCQRSWCSSQGDVSRKDHPRLCAGTRE
jgi:hypothetical protein